MHACLSFNENKNVQEYTCMINELQATSLFPFFLACYSKTQLQPTGL